MQNLMRQFAFQWTRLKLCHSESSYFDSVSKDKMLKQNLALEGESFKVNSCRIVTWITGQRPWVTGSLSRSLCCYLYGEEESKTLCLCLQRDKSAILSNFPSSMQLCQWHMLCFLQRRGSDGGPLREHLFTASSTLLLVKTALTRH